MAKCKCCNCLGSSRIFQAILIIALLLLFILLGVCGISIINARNFVFDFGAASGRQSWRDTLEATHAFYHTAIQLAYWCGAVVGVLWLMALCSRCCAPCCCELSDVPHPCSPCCQMWHVLDVPFYLGVMIASSPVNTMYGNLNDEYYFYYAPHTPEAGRVQEN
eukprot:Skav217789  [mRNA]  locus=scaffold1782:293227:293932:- [translate_table: standard]